MPDQPFGLPRIAVSDRSTRDNKTGSWKYIRPMYRDGVAPCNRACPAGIDVEGYMNLLRQDRVDDAVALLLEENPMPAITGRVCHHPCEASCNRLELDQAVSVHAVERALGDAILRQPSPEPPRRTRAERVAVVGSGPAGLSAAYHLVRLGYGVTVLDEADKPGGMLRQGIPAYRLPRDILDLQIARIAALGVEFRMGTRIDADAIDTELAGYDAVFLATGAHRPKPLGVPGEDGPGILPGLEFLKAVNRGERPDIGQRVAVIGGGNTAMDCARTALRLGSTPLVVYRRTRSEMPAIPQEVTEAIQEGIEFVLLAAPSAFHHEDGRLMSIQVTRMELGEPDESGRRRPVPIDDGGFKIPVDTVLSAIGEEADLDALPASLPRAWGGLRVDAVGATGVPRFFAGGDVAGADRTVSDAIGSGKRAAMGIHHHLRGGPDAAALNGDLDRVRWAEGNVSMARWRGRDPVRRTDPINRVVGAESLQLAHFPPVPRHEDAWRSGPLSFAEVNLGLDLVKAVEEARRCLNCAVCNDCELCLIFCPDAAINRRAGGGFEIDLDHCKGCGVCAEECPRGAIVMTREGL